MDPTERLNQALSALHAPRSGRLHFEYAESSGRPGQPAVEGSAVYEVVFNHEAGHYAISVSHVRYGAYLDDVRVFAGAGYAFLREVREIEVEGDSPFRSDICEYNETSLEARWHAIALTELLGPFGPELAVLGSSPALRVVVAAAQEVEQTEPGRWRIRTGAMPDLWRSSAEAGPGLLPAPCWLAAPEVQTWVGGKRAHTDVSLSIDGDVLNGFDIEDRSRDGSRRLSMRLVALDQAVSVAVPDPSECGEPLVVRPMVVGELSPVHYLDDLTVRLEDGTRRVISALRHEDDSDGPWIVGQHIGVMSPQALRKDDPEGYEDDSDPVAKAERWQAVSDPHAPHAVAAIVKEVTPRLVGEKATFTDPTGDRESVSLLVQLPVESRLALGEWVLAHERHVSVIDPRPPMFIQRLSDGKVIIGRAPWREPIPQNEPSDFAPDDWA